MRRHSFSALAFALACGAAFAACGGKSNAQSGLGTDTTPPPPPTGTGGGDSTGPSRVVSKDAAADFAAAADYFTKQEAAGWTSSSCETAAKKFAGVADDHRTIIEARYMQGLSYHRCNMAAPAEAAYQATIKADPNYAMAESNLGELYFAAGKRDAAKQYWDSAVKKMPKLTGARINLASLLLEDMRTTTDATKWAALDEEARKHLSSSLAVDNENVRAYTVYALVYMEGRAKNKNRLDLAKVMIDEGLKRSDKFAPLKNAFGLWYMTKNNLTAALTQFQAAVSLDPKFVEARMNVGLINLGVRKFADAKAQFAAVLEMDAKNYDAHIGMGVAERGLLNFDAAEASYNKAKALDPARGDAVFDLGVLYFSFKAAKAGDTGGLKATKAAYETAKKYFEQFVAMKTGSAEDQAEAALNVKDIAKMIQNLEDFIKFEAASAADAAAAGGGGT